MCSVIQVETVLLSFVRFAMNSTSFSFSSLLSADPTVLAAPFSFLGVSDSTDVFEPKLKLAVEEGAVASAAGLPKLKLLKAAEEGVEAAPNPAKPENTFGFPYKKYKLIE